MLPPCTSLSQTAAPHPHAIRALRVARLALAALALALPVTAHSAPSRPPCGPGAIGAPCPPSAPPVALNPSAGNPVHLATGNKYLFALDLPDPAGLSVERHYNALDPRTGALGKGWQHGYATRLYAHKTRINIVQADGTRHVFACNSAACRASGGSGTLQPQPATGPCRQAAWHWESDQADHVCFDSEGALSALQRPGQPRIRVSRHTDGPFEGLIDRIDNADGAFLRWSYRNTSDGVRLTQIQTRAGDIQYSYSPDARTGQQQLTAMRRPDGQGRYYAYEPALQPASTAALTAMGFLTESPNRRWRTHTWRYDAQGRVAGMSWGADRSGQTVQITYGTPVSGSTRTTHVKTPAGETRFVFSARPHTYVLDSVEGVGCPGCAAPGLRAKYDEAGRLTRLGNLALKYHSDRVLSEISRHDQGWPRLSMHFDTEARLTAWAFEDASKETRQRPPDGRTTERRFASGDIWRRTEQAAGHTRLTMQRGLATVTVDVMWENGRPVRISHPEEQETRRYDPAGRLIEKTLVRPHGTGVGRSSTIRDRYQHDRAGRVVRHALPEGGALKYDWSPTGSLARITWLDARGQAHHLLNSTERAGYELANGAKVDGLLRDGRLQALSVTLPKPDRSTPAAPVWAQYLTYDAQGNIASERWLGRQADGTPGITGEAHYQYDVDRRIRSASPRTYRWTHAGFNRDAPRMTRDADGLPQAYGRRRLIYGPERRLQQVLEDDTLLVRYGHNAWGARIWRTTATGETTHFFFDNHKLVAQARPDAQGTLQIYRRYIYAAGVPVALLDYHGGGKTTVHALITDAVGAPWLALNNAGEITWQAALTPTGQAHIAQSTITLPLRLPGQWYDAATGWHDNYLRTYDPDYGHYLEPDPLGPLPETQAYGYAAQQPRRFADPAGLLLFAFDGTRRNLASDTNVAQFVRQYAGPVHYAAGPGNPDRMDMDAATASSAPAILAMQWERLIADLREQPLAQHAIDIVGFSRGAALGRVFGNRIAARLNQGRFSWQDASGAIVSACLNLRFLGLFDTVKRFGILGTNDADYDTRVSAQWQWVAHAVALHEHRGQFPLSTIGATGPARQEMPFIGAHSDIGGGYLVEAGDPGTPPRGSLGAITLAWMRWQARQAGVALLEPSEPIVGTRATLHDERLPISRQLDTDRSVQAPDARGRAVDQSRHARYGKAMRDEVEQFITRNRQWMTTTGNRIGQVALPGYLRWLKQRLGLILNLIPPRGAFHAIIDG